VSNSELRTAIDAGDVDAVHAIVTERPELATAEIAWQESCGGGDSSEPLNYVSLARFHNLADHDRMGDITGVLLRAGAPVDGAPDTEETPLITAASYGEPGVARALVEAGANLEAAGHAAPGGTALAHAVYYGNPELAEIVVAAGARVNSLAEAAGADQLGGRPIDGSSPDELAWALRAAAVCDRPAVIDLLLAAGADFDAETEGATALHHAASFGKLGAVRHLVERGADPSKRDAEHDGTPLSWCRHRQGELFSPSPEHQAVERYLESLTAVG